MKKRLGIIMLSVLLMINVVACQSTKNELPTDAPIDVQKLFKYKDSYVGDNSAVGNIVALLPGNTYYEGMALYTKQRPYGIEVTYSANSQEQIEAFADYWTREQTEKIMLTNATVFCTLIPNVDEVIITIKRENDIETRTITRSELDSFYGKSVREYAENPEQWEKVIIDSTLSNKEDVHRFFQNTNE